MKHGIGKKVEGGTVTIRSRAVGGAVSLTISDDGVGFAAEPAAGEARQSVGMAIAQYRLEEVVGAHVRVESEPGAGTVVTILIPQNGVGLKGAPDGAADSIGREEE